MYGEIKVIQNSQPKTKPDQSKLGFGKYFTDHMFVMDYSVEKGWHDPRIEPYAPLTVDPATNVFHYGQAIFEGMKAYRAKNGKIVIFRPADGFERLNRSCRRMCMPEIDGEFALQALNKLIAMEREWVPVEKGTALYIRPFVIGTDPYLGVKPSKTYKFMIILSPVGAYYAEGFNPIKIYVETHYVRAAIGGTGEAKCAGNYAGSLLAAEEATKKGYSQVLWLDAAERKYVEEVGAMNIFFKIDGKVITPKLVGSILPGITRNSVIQVLKDMGVPVEERRISIDEIDEAYQAGKLEEVFGSGTAAVISPVGELNLDGKVMAINDGKIGELSLKLYDTITGIQSGELEDKHDWVKPVE